jgi:hypothetical protein
MEFFKLLKVYKERPAPEVFDISRWADYGHIGLVRQFNPLPDDIMFSFGRIWNAKQRI